MKFNEMTYTRPDIGALRARCKELAAKAAVGRRLSMVTKARNRDSNRLFMVEISSLKRRITAPGAHQGPFWKNAVFSYRVCRYAR